MARHPCSECRSVTAPCKLSY